MFWLNEGGDHHDGQYCGAQYKEVLSLNPCGARRSSCVFPVSWNRFQHPHDHARQLAIENGWINKKKQLRQVQNKKSVIPKLSGLHFTSGVFHQSEMHCARVTTYQNFPFLPLLEWLILLKAWSKINQIAGRTFSCYSVLTNFQNINSTSKWRWKNWQHNRKKSETEYKHPRQFFRYLCEKRI